MDILIRIVIMILIGIALPFIANIIYKPIQEIEELNVVEKILWGLFYAFIMNWFVIIPAVIFMDCFKYIFT